MNIKYIYPSENLGGVLNFDEDNAKKNLKLGYYDTIKAFKSLKGDKYYITPNENQEIYFEILSNMTDEKINELGEIFGIYYHCSKRMLFEFIIPELARLLKLEEDYDYEDLVIGVLEEVAYKFQVERFKVYSVREFFEEIARIYEYSVYTSSKSENMIKRIMEKEFFNVRSKEDIMMMVFNIVKDIVEIP